MTGYSRSSTQKFIGRTKGTFTSLIQYCCSDESHRIRKIERWMGAFDHYTSNITVLGQFNWVLKNNELSKEALKKFLNATISIVRSAAPIFSTQMNECFNSIKARYASKLLNWKSSFVGRVCMAVLQINNPYKWVNDLRRVLKLPPLTPSIEKAPCFHCQENRKQFEKKE